MNEPVLEIELPLKRFKRGKVRDIFQIDDNLLIVATDRISAFDVVLPTGIPDKGKILTAISCFWFDFTKFLIESHLISANLEDFPSLLKEHREVLKQRSMLVKKSSPLPIECVVRGYLAGSGWKQYQEEGKICGVSLPAGLKKGSKLPEPIFTPTTKEEAGHDRQLTLEEVREKVGSEAGEYIKKMSLQIYKEASRYAESKGIIISDTKFEFGYQDNKIILIDEIFTPDSSRFWPQDEYRVGGEQVSFDKQYVRNYLESLDWDKTPPAPDLPEEIVINTRKKYLEAYTKLTGRESL